VANVLCALSFRDVGTNRHKEVRAPLVRTYRLKVDMRPVLASAARIVQEFDLTAATGVDRRAERRACCRIGFDRRIEPHPAGGRQRPRSDTP